MGQSKLRRETFFRQHPICCFCDGATQATTRDHVPNRACFPGRHGPEGFEFPACKACQESTRLSEIAFATAVYLVRGDEEEHDSERFLNLLTGLRNNLPGSADLKPMTTNEKRRALKKYDIARPTGQPLADLPVVKVPEEMHAHIAAYLRKMARAIFYRHTGRPAGSEYESWATWSYGKLRANQDAVRKWVEMTPFVVKGERTNFDFGGRFAYRLNYSEEIGIAAIGQFGTGLIFYVTCTPKGVAERLEAPGYRED